MSMNDSENVLTPDIMSTGVGGENHELSMSDSHDVPKDLMDFNLLTSKEDDCCIQKITILIDEYDRSTDVRKDKYASADVRVDKYNLPSNGTFLGKSTTAITGVDKEFIRNANKCNDEISRTKVILPYKLEDGPEDNVSYGKKPPDLIDRGGYNNSENQSEDDDDNSLGKNDTDIDEEELTTVLHGEDFGTTVSQIMKTTMIHDAYPLDETVRGINDIRWSETAGTYKMVNHYINVKYNRSDEW